MTSQLAVQVFPALCLTEDEGHVTAVTADPSLAAVPTSDCWISVMMQAGVVQGGALGLGAGALGLGTGALGLPLAAAADDDDGLLLLLLLPSLWTSWWRTLL